MRARVLNARHGRAAPALLFLTDLQRTPDLAAIVRLLPRGAGVIYRAYGAPDRGPTARMLRTLTHRRGIRLLVAGDPALAIRVRADGLHLPERHLPRAYAWRRTRPHALLTIAAHGGPALARSATAGADAVLLSPVFATTSHPERAPLEARQAAALVQRVDVPVIALGGINARTAALVRGPFAGLAAIGAFTGD